MENKSLVVSVRAAIIKMMVTAPVLSFAVHREYAEISNEIIIQRPIHAVFVFLADYENMPKWKGCIAGWL